MGLFRRELLTLNCKQYLYTMVSELLRILRPWRSLRLVVKRYGVKYEISYGLVVIHNLRQINFVKKSMT